MGKDTHSTIKHKFMIVAKSVSSRDYYISQVKEHYPNGQIFFANDGSEALTKITNAPPHVVFMDYELPKMSGSQLTERILNKSAFEKVSIIMVSILPKKEEFVDELISGRVQFLENAHDDAEVDRVLKKAVAIATGQAAPAEFLLKTLTEGETLFHQGDPAALVYIVKTGKLKALKSENGLEVVLGHINPGEFVGEMAYLQDQPRSATVIAEQNSELIEVPMGTLERILHQRPTWSKALMATLSKRVSKSNSEKPEKT